MSFVRTTSESEATGPLAEAYQRLGDTYLTPARRQRGTTHLPPIVTVFSAAPALMEARVRFSDGLYQTGRSGLGRRKEELIATQVAALSGCLYCGLGHAEFLRAACAMPDSEVACVITDWRAAKLEDDERAMLAFTEKLTLAPFRVGESDRSALRKAGFDDAATVTIALGASYRHFIDRVADLLGVEADHGEFSSAVLDAFGVTSTQVAATLYGKIDRGAPRPREITYETRRSEAEERDLEEVLGASPRALEGHRALAAALGEAIPERRARAIEDLVIALLAGDAAPKGAPHGEPSAILRYAKMGTIEERSTRADDVKALAEAGLSDADIVAVATQIAFVNYAVRLSAATGASLRSTRTSNEPTARSRG